MANIEYSSPILNILVGNVSDIFQSRKLIGVRENVRYFVKLSEFSETVVALALKVCWGKLVQF